MDGIIIIVVITSMITSFTIGLFCGITIYFLFFKQKIKEDISKNYILIEKPKSLGKDKI
jgi:MFS superfamily sulfate permease-like transporter